MTRKEFIQQVGGGSAALFLLACTGACKKKSTSANPQGPSSVNFTVDISSGPLANVGGYMVQSGVIVARTGTNSFAAIAASCTHEGGTLQYSSSKFVCPLHGATFDTNGNVTSGPANNPEKKYNTSLSGTQLRVYS